jgi:hypothetical protein
MQKRPFLVNEAIAFGRGGIAKVIRITGVSRNTVKHGINELKNGVLFDGRVRKSVAGVISSRIHTPVLKKKSEN